MTLLMNSDHENAITWLPDGKYFAVRSNGFRTTILHECFGMDSIESFLSELHMWGFAVIETQRVGIEVFRHKLFRKGDWDQCHNMHRLDVYSTNDENDPEGGVLAKRRLSPGHWQSSALAGAERIFKLLDEPVLLQDAEDAIEMPPIQGAVTFDRVSFGYSTNRLILKDVTLHTKPGQTIALVGATGAGKSTIINLILRFYDVTAGAVKIDGIDVRSVTQASLHRQIGLVLQENILFSGTVAENIAFGRATATQVEIEAAAQIANVHEFIVQLPQGYRTLLGEKGANLSQGQRQLISIARAVLVNPRILILDEATSSIDTRTEILVQQAIDKLLTNRTSFVIAHRLSTVTKADRVLVIQQGQIAEQGTHAELVEQQGIYANLYAMSLS